MTTREKTRLPIALGERIDNRYELLSVLGSGGFGVVYKARQISTEQDVAIKVLRTDKIDANDTTSLGRFEREMRLIGKIRHPNIVRLIDFGIHEALPYMVIEFVEGETLADVLTKEGGLRPRETKRFMGQVLHALSAVHGQDVVYRDLKPQNIMITQAGHRRDAIILDFGISGLTEEAESKDIARLTMVGSIRGTPAYMAPEQLKLQKTTVQTDIYAWGLVFLEAVTAKQIMEGESNVEVMAAQISKTPVPIPVEIASAPCGAIIAKAVEKDLESRWQSVGDLIEFFDECRFDGNFHLPWTGEVAMERLRANANRASLSSSEIFSPINGTLEDALRNPTNSTTGHPPLMNAQDASGTAQRIGTKKPFPMAIVIGGAIGIVGLAAAAFFATQGDEAPAEQAVVQPEVVKAPVVAEKVEEFEVSISVSPKTAAIFLDGRPVGSGQFVRLFPKDGSAHVLDVELEGYTSVTVPFKDQRPGKARIVLKKGAGVVVEASADKSAAKEALRTFEKRKKTRKPARPSTSSKVAAANVAEVAPAEALPEVVAPEPAPADPAAENAVEAQPVEEVAAAEPEVVEAAPAEAEPEKEEAHFEAVGGADSPDPWKEKGAEKAPDPWAETAKEKTPDPWN